MFVETIAQPTDDSQPVDPAIRSRYKLERDSALNLHVASGLSVEAVPEDVNAPVCFEARCVSSNFSRADSAKTSSAVWFSWERGVSG